MQERASGCGRVHLKSARCRPAMFEMSRHRACRVLDRSLVCAAVSLSGVRIITPSYLCIEPLRNVVELDWMIRREKAKKGLCEVVVAGRRRSLGHTRRLVDRRCWSPVETFHPSSFSLLLPPPSFHHPHPSSSISIYRSHHPTNTLPLPGLLYLRFKFHRLLNLTAHKRYPHYVGQSGLFDHKLL